MQYGSLQNTLHGAANRPGETEYQWEVGAGATTLRWSDRDAHTVVAVISDREIHIQRDRAKFAPGSMGTQVESYTPDPDAPIEVVKLGAAGWRTVNPATGRYGKKSGQRVIPGRDAYRDPSF